MKRVSCGFRDVSITFTRNIRRVKLFIFNFPVIHKLSLLSVTLRDFDPSFKRLPSPSVLSLPSLQEPSWGDHCQPAIFFFFFFFFFFGVSDIRSLKSSLVSTTLLALSIWIVATGIPSLSLNSRWRGWKTSKGKSTLYIQVQTPCQRCWEDNFTVRRPPHSTC